MLWTELTSDRFSEAIERCGGLCLLPFGSLERHGPHLPLGTDYIVAEEVCRRAAEREPAVVFPGLYFAQIAEARHCPGTVSLDHELLLRLLKGVLAEIGRNGFSKILIANGHGGNNGLLSYLMMSLLQQEPPYVAYTVNLGLSEEHRERWEQMREAEQGGHAGESETSVLMHLRPEAVEMANLGNPADGEPRGRLNDLPARNPMWWYADYPTHFAGDPRAASAEKGEFLVDAMARRLVEVVRAVKEDGVTPELQAEFHARTSHTPLSREADNAVG